MRNIMFISFSPRIRSNGRIALLLIMVLLLAHSPPRYTPLSPMDIPMSNNWSDLPTSRGCFPPLSLVATTIAVAASQKQLSTTNHPCNTFSLRYCAHSHHYLLRSMLTVTHSFRFSTHVLLMYI